MAKDDELSKIKPDDLVNYKKAPVPNDSARVKELEKRIDGLMEQLERARKPKFKGSLSVPSFRELSSGDSFCRVIVPDSHGCFIDEGAASTFIKDLEYIQPRSVVMLGDHIDCGGFLAQHHTIGFVAESEYTFEDDVAAANQFLDEIQKSSPSSEVEYLEGNHERRIEKWIVTETLRNKADSGFLTRMFSTESVLSLVARGIKFYKQGRFYDDLRIPGTIRRDGCYFTHGEYCGKNAASQHLNKYNGNIWYAHTHRRDLASKRTVKDGEIGAWNPGALCKLQPLWMHTNLTDWVHGYGLQLVTPGVGHLNIPVPIIDNNSYLNPLVNNLGLSRAVDGGSKKAKSKPAKRVLGKDVARSI